MFGSGLERLSHVKMFYFMRENRELVNLDSCELIQSQFAVAQDYPASVALDYFAEVADQLLPPHEPSERFFRLLVAVLEHVRRNPADNVWPAVLYFTLWAVRLSGFLPAFEVSPEARDIALEMMQTPIGQLSARKWTKSVAADLRRQLVHAIEEHLERRLVTARALESL